jgi:hypothetical protein
MKVKKGEANGKGSQLRNSAKAGKFSVAFLPHKPKGCRIYPGALNLDALSRACLTCEEDSKQIQRIANGREIEDRSKSSFVRVNSRLKAKAIRTGHRFSLPDSKDSNGQPGNASIPRPMRCITKKCDFPVQSRTYCNCPIPNPKAFIICTELGNVVQSQFSGLYRQAKPD